MTISQLLIERVDPGQRGVVNGVQFSLNMLMDMLKSVLVIVAPLPSQFGILVIISFVAICAGGVSYAMYSRKIRGHLFHPEKFVCHNNNEVTGDNERNPAAIAALQEL